MLKRCHYDLVHIIITVLAKTSTEDYILFVIRESFVFFVKCVIFFVIYRIIRFVTGFPFHRILAADDSFFLCPKYEMLMLYYSGIRSIAVSVVNDGISLIIISVKNFRVKSYVSVFEISKAMVEI